MAIIVGELAKSIEKVTLTSASNAGNGIMKTSKAFYDSTKPLKAKLAEGLDLTCPFEPIAFIGDRCRRQSWKYASRDRRNL